MRLRRMWVVEIGGHRQGRGGESRRWIDLVMIVLRVKRIYIR